MSLKNISVSAIKYDLSAFKEVESVARKLLPEKIPEILQFDVIANSRIANAIRRTIEDEVIAKSLEPGNVETNDVYVLKDELKNNIRQIPIDQSIPLDATFSLAVENNRSNVLPVKSGQIRTSIKTPFNSRIELCSLNQGKKIRIKDITVVEGRGRNNSRFSLTSVVGFKMLDFMEVYYLNNKNKCESYMLPTKQVMEITKISNRENILYKKILIIPTKTQQTYMSDKLKKQLAHYDIVVEPTQKSKIDLTKLRNYQSTEYHAKEFRLKVRTLGTIPALKLLDLSLATLLQELTYIHDMKEYAVELSQTDDVYHFHLKNTSHTLGEPINYIICEMNPDIGLANLTKRDPISNSITINIKHTEAVKVFKTAVEKLINTFESMRKSVSKS